MNTRYFANTFRNPKANSGNIFKKEEKRTLEGMIKQSHLLYCCSSRCTYDQVIFRRQHEARNRS